MPDPLEDFIPVRSERANGVTYHYDSKGNILGEIDELIVTNKPRISLRDYLLSLPGEFYYHNVSYWREAMAYMRSIRDNDAEYAIYRKRFDYGRSQWAKGVFSLMGGIVGSVLTIDAIVVGYVGITAGSASATTTGAKIWNVVKNIAQFNRPTTYCRMTMNGLVQAAFDPEHFRGINISSVLAEGLIPGVGMLTEAIEIRPFSRVPGRTFRIVGYNKTVSETIFDMSLHYGAGRLSGGVSKYVKNAAEPESLKYLKYFAYPIYYNGYQFILQGSSMGTKNALGIGNNSNDGQME